MTLDRMKLLPLIAGIFIFVAEAVFAQAPTPPPGDPITDADLTFRTTNRGVFVATVTTDVAVDETCEVELYARRDIDDEIGSTVFIGSVDDEDDTTITFRATQLPAVKNVNGNVPKAHLQARVTCDGNDPVTTNVFARFIRCGRGRRLSGEATSRVSIDRWLEVLAEKVE